MSLLTDRAEDAGEALLPWLTLGAWVFVCYALARHVDWQDAVGSVLFARLALRSIETRGGR